MLLFDIFVILSSLGLIAFIGLAAAKLFVRYVMLKPLISKKMAEVEDDPDFNWRDYIDTDLWE